MRAEQVTTVGIRNLGHVGHFLYIMLPETLPPFTHHLLNANTDKEYISLGYLFAAVIFVRPSGERRNQLVNMAAVVATSTDRGRCQHP